MDNPTNYLGPLYGLEDIADILCTSLQKNRLSHAILLNGPEGIGKTTLLCRFARALILTNHSKIKCDIQKYILGEAASIFSTSPLYRQFNSLQYSGFVFIRDLYQKNSLIPKKHRGISVDEIRFLKEFVSMKAHDDNWRIILLDGVDYMNQSASNALLKTLEEPGEGVLIFLTAHNLSAVSETIKSRCTFLKARPASFTHFTKAIQWSHKTPLQATHLETIYKRSKGSIGTALAILQQDSVPQSASELISALISSILVSEDTQILTHLSITRLQQLIYLREHIKQYNLDNAVVTALTNQADQYTNAILQRQ